MLSSFFVRSSCRVPGPEPPAMPNRKARMWIPRRFSANSALHPAYGTASAGRALLTFTRHPHSFIPTQSPAEETISLPLAPPHAILTAINMFNWQSILLLIISYVVIPRLTFLPKNVHSLLILFGPFLLPRLLNMFNTARATSRSVPVRPTPPESPACAQSPIRKRRR